MDTVGLMATMYCQHTTATIPRATCLPNGASLQFTNTTCNLDLPKLPIDARDVQILPGLMLIFLILIGKLCHAGCTAIFDEHKVIIQNNNNTLLQGKAKTIYAQGYGVYHEPKTL
jgi:hypothetical protein